MELTYKLRTLIALVFIVQIQLNSVSSEDNVNNGPEPTNSKLLNKSSESLSMPDNNDNSCIIKRNNHFYDLSKLSVKRFWFYSELTHNDSHLIFLLSICHPILDVTSCEKGSGACFTYLNNTEVSLGYHGLRDDILLDELSFTNAGKLPEKLPEVIQEGSLKYTYENGKQCKRGNTKMGYKTELHLQCPLSAEDESPGPILMASPRCFFIFVWMTLAACPKQIEKKSDPCIIQFSNSEYPLNLHSLHTNTYYKAYGLNSSFEINICGPVQNGSCSDNAAVCETSKNESPKALVTSEDVEFTWEDSTLILTYKSKSTHLSTNIHLHCDRSAMIPRFFLSSKTSNSYNFSVHTVNVCNPKSSDCVIEDKKLNVFDLRPLHKKEENWQVIGRKSNESAVLFCLNVCGPVNQNTDCNCPPGPIGACQAGRSTSLSKNIGYITSDPVANDDGSLTLMYTGGDSCREGVRTSSTRISFICSEVDYPPVFLRVSDSCEHLFAWHTPAACPVNVVRSKTCQVTDPFFGHTFDLNVLRNDTWDYRVTNGNLDFLVNVCGPLVAPCGGRQGTTAVCELGVEQRSGGEVPAELVFNDGTLMMTFSDGAVGCGSRWRSQVLFLCSHNDEGLEGLQYLHADESACVHHFIWHTTHACPPHTEVDCSVSDGDLTYDLTPLSNPNMNEIFITYGRGKKYVLNVCRSVIHSKDSRCAYDAGACVIDMNHENSSLSLGKVEAGPYVEDGVLMVKYKDGDACNGSHAYTTIIEFECTDKQYLSYPILYAEEDCTMFFKWSTVFACPKNTSSTLEDSLHNCTAINPLTNYVFDMNSLTKPNKPHELSITEGVTLLVSACGAVNDTRCPAGSGACVVGRNGAKSSAGKANKELRFRTWSTYLEYSGGEECANGFKRSTRISFICQEGETVSGPILISDDIDSCIFFVNWYTESACERHIRCFAHNFDRTFDLSPLIRNWGNYEVRDPTNPNSTYLLNVCRPLNPVIGVNCHPGSSSCLVRKNEPPLGLGHPILNPTVVGGDEVHLMYAHGSACPTDPELPLSSRIIFICNRTAGAGTPRFFKKSFECQIQFEWPTSLVCPPIVSEGAQCQIAFEPAKTNVDLTSLKGTTPYRVTHRGHAYLLNLCGANACGNNSAVCSDDGTSFGRSDQTKLQWDGPALQLSFYGGGLCEGAISGSRSARIFFKCDQSAGFGTPVVDPLTYNPNLHCIVVFSWRTNLTCLEAPYPDSSPTSRPAPNSTSTTRPAPSSINPTPFTPTSAPHREDEDTMSEHTWVSAAVAVCVVVGVAAVVVWVAGRSTRGRRWLGRAKRALVRKGDQEFILDDHL